jgi:hypothetical protein
MGPEPLSLVVFMALLKVELGRIEGDAVRALAAASVVPPYPKHLIWEGGNKDMYIAWVFAEFESKTVGAVYCDRGAGYREAQWGLVDLKSEYFGPDTRWFPSVDELFVARVRN